MAFDLFILCIIAAAFAMLIVSVLQDAARRFRRARASVRDRQSGLADDLYALAPVETRRGIGNPVAQ
jgi:hypothetical protein